MKSPEDIEKALQRLIPPALSERTQADVSSMLYSLSSSAPPSSDEIKASFRSSFLGFRLSIAAALAIALVSIASWFSSLERSSENGVIAQEPVAESPGAESDASPVLIDRMQLTDGMTIEGTLAAADGSVINQVNRRVQTRERYRDEKKGYLITISETRDEKVYLPKKGF